MKIILLVFLITTCLLGCAQKGEDLINITDVDRVRFEIKNQIVTNSQNVVDRKSTLIRYWRYLWRQGYDVTKFDSLCLNLIYAPLESVQMYDAINSGYQVLDDIYSKSIKVKELKGSAKKEKTSLTNWPVYMGVDGGGKGFSPDAGPSKGEVVWKFPKHHSWNARPVIEKGKVYLTSPGIDVMGYCLDEETGKVLWNARQYGLSAYDVLTAKSDPIVSDSNVLFRNGWGEKGVHIYDKKGNKLDSHEAFQQPRSGNDYLLNYNKDIYLADRASGKIFAVYKVDGKLVGESQLENGFIYGLTETGKVYKYDINKYKSPVWIYDSGVKTSGPLKLGTDHIYFGNEKGQLRAIDKQTGTLKWSYSTERFEARARQQYAQIIEKDDFLYTANAGSQVIKLSRASGEVVWHYELDDWVRSKPIVMGNKVYAATLSGNLYALEDKGNSVKLLWKKTINEHGFTADLVANEHRILLSGRDLIMYSVALDGSLQWKHGIVDGNWVDDEYYMADWTPGLMTTPTVVDGIVYVGGGDNFVNAIDAETGKEIWKFETNKTTSVAPTVADGKVFIGQIYGEDFYALDAKTGALVWETDAFKQVWVGAAYNNGKLFVGDKTGFMHGVDPDNGELLWTYFSGKDTPLEGKPLDLNNQIHGWPPGIHSNTVVDQTKVYFGSWSGYYFALDQNTGDLVWRVKTSSEDRKGLPDSAAPMLSGDYLYVQKLGSTISAVHKDKGTIDWQWKAPEAYLQNGTVAADENRIYGSYVRDVVMIPYNATIVAFDKVENGGKELWKYNGGGGLTAPVLTKDRLYTGSSSHTHLSCLNSATGEVIWRLHTGGELLENVPAIYGDQLFVHTKNGYILAVE